MPTHNDLNRLIELKNRRLQQLKLTEARFGFNTSPEVLIEMEDLQTEIEALQQQRAALPPAAEPATYHITISDSSGFAIGQGATVVNNPAPPDGNPLITATPPIGLTNVSASPPISPAQGARRRLEQRRLELQTPLETYNRRVVALAKDLARELDSQRKVILEEQLAEVTAERDKLQTELDEIEDQLG